MNVNLAAAKPELATFEIQGKTIKIGPVKGKHMVKAQNASHPKAGSVELGYRTLAYALLEYMADEAPTYDELLELPSTDLAPLMALIGG